MPQRDGKGPPWGSGSGTGRRFNQGVSMKGRSSPDTEREPKSITALISSVVTLLGSLIELFSSKNKLKKRD